MSDSLPPRLCGLVLAGGRSSRMGRDKASLPHPDGRTLVRRSLDLLRDAGCAEVFVSLRHAQPCPAGLPEDAPFLRDPENGSSGPLSGLLAAMEKRPQADWLAIACDLPRLDLPTLQALVRARQTHPGCIAYRSEFDGAPEPLCAIYPAASRGTLETFRASGNFRLRDLLSPDRCLLLDPPRPGALANANTVRDWQEAIRPFTLPPAPSP